ncbi:MAG: hypothetical protein ACKPCM_01970, partial [Pseudanabaena sp.]
MASKINILVSCNFYFTYNETKAQNYSGFQMSAYSFENKKTSPVRVLDFHLAYRQNENRYNIVIVFCFFKELTHCLDMARNLSASLCELY